MKGVSTIWSVFWKDGELLSDRDLLKGDIVRPMSGNLASCWNVIADAVTECCDLIEDSDLKFRQHYDSINAVIILWCWYTTAMQWKSSQSLSAPKKDSFEKEIAEILRMRVDRWIVLSKWARKWSSSTDVAVAKYAADIAEDWKTIKEVKDTDVVLDVLRERIDGWIAAFRSDSSRFINSLDVDHRNLVGDYFTALWLWNRLDEKRWESAKILLRENRKKFKREVDHLVAVKFWADGKEPPEIHALGNCSLLEKSFNIAKAEGALETFLLKVHVFKNRESENNEKREQRVKVWKTNLEICGPLYNPAGYSTEEILKAIEVRTESIKSDLQAYVSGQKDRVDLTS